MSDTLEVGLEAYYKFSNNFLDSSGNGRHLTQINTVNFIADKDCISNNAVSFEGEGNSLETAYPNTPASPCISAWVKDISPYTSTSAKFLVCINGIARYWQGFTLAFINKEIGFTSNFYGETHVGVKYISDGNWHHCVVQFDDTTKVLKFYVDKILVYMITYANSITYSATRKIQLGTASTFPYEADGYLDEVRIYNRNLTDGGVATGQVATGEIAELFDMGVNYSPDTNPPSFNSASIDTIAYNSANLNVNSNEDGKVYYKVLPRNATAPTSTDIKANPDGQTNVKANTTSIISLTGLTSSTNLDCYVVAEDTVLNLQLEPTRIEFTTLPSPPATPTRYIQPPKIIVKENIIRIESHYKIYYTTDGSYPNDTSLQYTTPISMPPNTTIITAIAYSEQNLSFSHITQYTLYHQSHQQIYQPQ